MLHSRTILGSTLYKEITVVNKYKLVLILIILLITSFAYAEYVIPYHVVIAPNCLIKTISSNYQTLASDGNISLITINDVSQLIGAKMHQKKPCGGFMNVTKAWQEYARKNTKRKGRASLFFSEYVPQKHKASLLKSKKTTYKVQYPKQVNILLNQLNPQRIWGSLNQLMTNFPNRFALKWVPGDNGARTTEWIKNQRVALQNP